MNKATGKLTVFYEGPFWVGVFEKIEDGKLSAAREVFGAEPKDNELYDFILKRYYSLKFSPEVEISVKEDKKNPKRRQRNAAGQTQETGVGTKSQQALKLQHEQFKTERRCRSREQKDSEALRLFELKQQKKKEKHRGH